MIKFRGKSAGIRQGRKRLNFLLTGKRHSFPLGVTFPTQIGSHPMIYSSWSAPSIRELPVCHDYRIGRQDLSPDHFPLATDGANSRVLSRNPSQQVFPGFLGGFLRLFLCRDPCNPGSAGLHPGGPRVSAFEQAEARFADIGWVDWRELVRS